MKIYRTLILILSIGGCIVWVVIANEEKSKTKKKKNIISNSKIPFILQKIYGKKKPVLYKYKHKH